MNGVNRHRYDMLVRVKQFGLAHPELFPPDTLGGRSFAALTAAVDQASDFLTLHVQGRGAARSGTLSKVAARTALRDTFGVLTRTAKAIAPDVPGLEGKFRLLSGGTNDLELLTAGRAFALAAAPLEPQFIAHGLPSTFLADLQAALESFERAAWDRVAAREARASARAGITAAQRAADDALARLDAIVPNTLREQPTVLAAWKVARHVQRTAARAAAPGPPQPVPPQMPAAPAN